MNKTRLSREIWQCVHNAHGEQVGLTSDDGDYIQLTDESMQYGLGSSGESKFNSKTSETETDQSNLRKSYPKNIVASCNLGCDPLTLRSTQSKLRIRLGLKDILSDASSSTDSEEENGVPFEITAECTSMHEGRQLVHTILPINIDSLLTMLFSKSKFFAEFHNMRRTTNIIYRDWVDNEDGTKTRTINFTVALAKGIGPKTSNITEVQVMRNCSVPDQLYAIDVTLSNAGIPYADSFKTVQHYCLMRTVDDHTMLSVYSQIIFTKNVWGFVKGLIERSAWNGMDNFFNDLINALQSEYCIPPAKSKSRRTKNAILQKSEEISSQRSSFKSNSKAVSAESPPAQVTFEKTKQTTSTAPSDEMMMNLNGKRSSSALDLFSAFIAILIVALVMLNVYLFFQLYALKSERANEVKFDQNTLKKLVAIDDPLAMKKSWLNLLNEQQILHEAELIKWNSFVKYALNSLQNIKDMFTKFDVDLKNGNIKDTF